MSYSCGAAQPEDRQHKWDFDALKWWSRIFEYRWLADIVATIPPQQRLTMTAIDAGCGRKHAGCFMLAEAGLGRVIALDRFEQHPLLDAVDLPNLSYAQIDFAGTSCPPAHLVCCVSVLEHIHPSQQERALINLCDAVLPGGLLLLTFDMPGFEFDTDLDGYREILRRHGFDFIEREVPQEQRLTSRNGPITVSDWPSVGRPELECYRLLARPRGSVQ
jgi:SAM-dependent methyltransferase